MRVLIGCESSGIVRDAFAALGHNAWSCDLKPSERPGNHLTADLLSVLDFIPAWDLLIAHPPCTYLAGSGLHWTVRGVRPLTETLEAAEFVERIVAANIPRIAIENPVGFLSRTLRKPDQIIQPFEFGDDASKATCLWLRGLPPLRPTKRIAGRIVNGCERFANQTDSGQNKLTPSAERPANRSRTYPGIAAAMAEQWGAAIAAAAGKAIDVR